MLYGVKYIDPVSLAPLFQATIVSSTFDNFTALLDPYKDAIPVLTQEIGDTWIYGTPSDPVKQATMRALMRSWAQYDDAGGAKDAVYLNASRLLVKSIEHTWGDHVELDSWQSNASWANAQFEQDRHSTCNHRGPHCRKGKDTFSFLESTWWEQRDYSTGFATEALTRANHPLWTNYLKDELDALHEPVVAPNPAVDGFTRFDPAKGPVTAGPFTMGFDTATGAIAQLDHAGASWASATNTLLGLQYQTYNITQFQAFQRAYSNLTHPPSYFPHDFGKPGDTDAVNYVAHAAAQSFWMKEHTKNHTKDHANHAGNGGSTATILIETKFSLDLLSTEYGAPQVRYPSLVSTRAAENAFRHPLYAHPVLWLVWRQYILLE